MFKHYVTAALRHFNRHRLTSSINVVCLTVGLVCFLASYSMVTYLSSGDRHFANADRVQMIRWSMNGSLSASAAPWLAGKFMKTDLPELETVARASIDVGIRSEAPISHGDRKSFANIAYADPELLEVFALPFLAGDSRNALRAPRSAVIAEDLATRFFGGPTAALGRSIRFQDGSEVTVRGVVGALKQPSHLITGPGPSMGHLRFDVLVSMDVIESVAGYQPMINNWGTPLFLTYAVLPKDGSFSADDLRRRLTTFGQRYADSAANKFTFDAVPLADYWLSNVGVLTGSGTPGRAGLMVFYFLGTVVLLASCLNYANLATAQGAARAKEIGMRRVVGAKRLQVATQFLCEAAVLTVLALVCAIILVAAAIILVGIPSVTAVALHTLGTVDFWLTLLIALAVVTFAAGSYPALVISGVRPIQAIRVGKVRSGNRIVSRFLVASQFAGASFLTIAMFVMWVQNERLKDTLGHRFANALVVMSNDVNAAGVNYDALKTELERQPHIESVTASMVSPWVMVGSQGAIATSPDATATKVPVMLSRIHHDYFSTLGIEVLAGRSFDRAHANDDASSSQASVIVDRAFAEQRGWVPLTEAIGKTIYEFDENQLAGPATTRTVIGVVETTTNSVLSPFGASGSMFHLTPQRATTPMLRIASQDAQLALKEIEAVWNRFAPSVAVKLEFADQVLNDSYQVFRVVSVVLGGVALLALGISLLGLVGMSIDVISRRHHEIGVRKTLGASVQSIVRMLLTDFSKPVVIANLIAWPLAFVVMQAYLNIFAQRTSLSLAPFVASFAFTVSIAWLAVAAQATRAARLNPATALRYE